MLISARCHPALEPLLPKPVPAKSALPDWLTRMPGSVESKSLGGETIRTLKHCPPFIDALGAGILLPLATDIVVTANDIAWAWDPPIILDAPITRSPIGVHVPEQADGAPVDTAGALFLKFNSFWTIKTPSGVSVLFTHPLNRDDLPFQTLSGLVDTDGFGDGYVHIPARLDPGFEGTIAKGTPIAQLIPVPREVTLDVATMSDAEIAASSTVQETLGAAPGAYRKSYRRRD